MMGDVRGYKYAEHQPAIASYEIVTSCDRSPIAYGDCCQK